MAAHIATFVSYLKFEKHYSVHTVRAYEDDLTAFFDYISVQFGMDNDPNISPSFIRSWLASMKDEGISARSINRKISSLKSFYKYQIRTGVMEQSPMTAIIGPKSGKRLPAYVEAEDISQLFSSIDFPGTWEGVTDRLLLAILYHTGLRVSELVNLRERQIDGSNRVIKVLGKGNKERIIPVSPVLLEMVQAYIVAKEGITGADREFLLVNKEGKQLYVKSVYLSVRKYLSLVTTIDQKSPHVLRHTFATHLMNGGAELNSVKELLGHSSLAATQVYTHNTIAKLKDVHKKAHPKA